MNKTMFDPEEQKKIGMLTPSSNTVLEPICSKMVSGLEQQVTMHYARFTVTKISLEKDALSQFDFDPMLRAAEHLAHADVDVIAWNGTSGGWLGFDMDEMLCEKITKATGIPATTSMLAQLDAFKEDNVKKLHLVTPYISKINELITEQYAKYGYEVVNQYGLAQTVNRSFSLVKQTRIADMVEAVCSVPADGISVVCTNLPAMWQVKAWEEKYGITVYDTIGVVVWKTLKMAGLNPNVIRGWGRLFDSK